MAREFALRAGAHRLGQRMREVALHQPPSGAVDRRRAHAHTRGDLFVAPARVGRQQDLRAFHSAHDRLAPGDEPS